MSDAKPSMAQENFASAGPPASFAPTDFSSDESALAYAEAQLDTLVEAMRYSLRKDVSLRFDLARVVDAGPPNTKERGDWRGHVNAMLAF